MTINKWINRQPGSQQGDLWWCLAPKCRKMDVGVSTAISTHLSRAQLLWGWVIFSLHHPCLQGWKGEKGPSPIFLCSRSCSQNIHRVLWVGLWMLEDNLRLRGPSALNQEWGRLECEGWLCCPAWSDSSQRMHHPDRSWKPYFVCSEFSSPQLWIFGETRAEMGELPTQIGIGLGSFSWRTLSISPAYTARSLSWDGLS